MPIDFYGVFGKSSTTGGAHINLTMGGLVFSQGLHVYLVQNPGSRPAIIVGAIVGGLYGASGYLINANQPEIGYGLGAAVSTALALRMGNYYIR